MQLDLKSTSNSGQDEPKSCFGAFCPGRGRFWRILLGLIIHYTFSVRTTSCDPVDSQNKSGPVQKIPINKYDINSPIIVLDKPVKNEKDGKKLSKRRSIR